MAITKQIGYTMEILEDGQIQVRQVTHIMEDGVEITKTYHRHVVRPGQSLINENIRVQAVAMIVHTPQVIAYWNEAERARAVLS